MASDSSDVDNALVAKLGADSALLALMPNGVYLDEAPPGATRFVIVSLIDEHDEQQFSARAFEDALYLIEARALSTSGGNVKDAAARIDTLLDNGTLAVAGYKLMLIQREERVRVTEVDDVDRSIRWQRRGGRYRVMTSVG
jgi:predicted PhzF superfamily epimerase YddE/YHI9